MAGNPAGYPGNESKRGKSLDNATARRLAELAGRRARLTMRHITGAGMQWRRVGQWPGADAPVSTLDHRALSNTTVAMEWAQGSPARAHIGSHRNVEHGAARPHHLIMPGRPAVYGDDPAKLAEIAEREQRDELTVRSLAWHASHDASYVAWAVHIHRATRKAALS